MTTYDNLLKIVLNFKIIKKKFGLHTTFIQVLPALFLSFSSYQVEWVLSQRVHIIHVIANITSPSTNFGDWIGCVAHSQMTVTEHKEMIRK